MTYQTLPDRSVVAEPSWLAGGIDRISPVKSPKDPLIISSKIAVFGRVACMYTSISVVAYHPSDSDRKQQQQLWDLKHGRTLLESRSRAARVAAVARPQLDRHVM